MTPYFQQDGITLYHGDCREVLPTLGRFDLLLTDPPYGIGVNHNMGRRAGDNPSKYDKCEWDAEPPEAALVALMFNLSANQIVWGGNHLVHLIGQPSPCWLVWDKKFSNDVTFAACELAYTSLPGTVKKFELSSSRKNGHHPTQKPLALIRWCLSFAPDAKTILDPFAGSGTTLLAAKLEGRQAVGIEISERYCEIAANRLRQKVLF